MAPNTLKTCNILSLCSKKHNNKTMKTKVMAILGLVVILSGCASNGTKFFISNHEDEAVSVQYKYYAKGQYADSTGYDYAPKSSVMVSEEILNKKVLKNYPFYDTKFYFHTLPVNKIEPLSYKLNIPAKSTIYIAPIHKYGESIEYLVLNYKDTIRFTPQSQNELVEKKLVTHKSSFVGNSYFLVNLKLKETEAILQK